MEKDAENEVLELTQAIQNSRLRRRHILRKAVVEHSKLPISDEMLQTYDVVKEIERKVD